MTDKERQRVLRSRPATTEDAVEFWRSLPSEEEFQIAMKGGEAKRGWYERFANVVKIFGDDRDLFTSILAANSTQNSVRRNLIEAMAIWEAWARAGRPTEIIKKTDKNGRQYQTMPFLEKLAKEDGMSPVLFEARRVPTIRLLAGMGDLEGLKTSDFAGSLAGNRPQNKNRSVNDAWMAMFGATDKEAEEIQQLFGKAPHYYAYSSRVRQAARSLGWETREGQETVWSLTLAMAGLAKAGLEPQEIVRHITHEHVRDSSVDYLDLLKGDQHVRDICRRMGILEAVDEAAGNASRGAASRRAARLSGPIFGDASGDAARLALRIAERAARYAHNFRGTLTPFADTVAAVKAERQKGKYGRSWSDALRYSSGPPPLSMGSAADIPPPKSSDADEPHEGVSLSRIPPAEHFHGWEDVVPVKDLSSAPSFRWGGTGLGQISVIHHPSGHYFAKVATNRGHTTFDHTEGPRFSAADHSAELTANRIRRLIGQPNVVPLGEWKTGVFDDPKLVTPKLPGMNGYDLVHVLAGKKIGSGHDIDKLLRRSGMEV